MGDRFGLGVGSVVMTDMTYMLDYDKHERK